MLDLAPPCVVTIMDNGTISRRQSDGAAVRSDEMVEAEVECQL